MIWKAATSESGALRHLTLVWLALTTTLVFGFLTVRASAPAGAQFRLIGVDLLEVAPAPAAPSTTVVVDLVAPAAAGSGDITEGRSALVEPAVVYAGVHWRLLEARFVSVTESSDGRPVIIAELDLTNTTETQALRVRESDVALVWSDGERFPADRFDQVVGSDTLTLDPGERRSITAVFKPRLLVDPVFEDTALEIGDPGRIPARLPLVGPMAPSIYPIDGSIEEGAAVVADPDRVAGRLAVTPRRAVLGLNAGAYRAAEGTRLVLIEVAIERSQVDDGSAVAQESANAKGSAFAERDFWRLTVDSSSLEPARIYRHSIGATDDELLTLVFVVDEGFDELSLEVAPGSAGSIDRRIQFADYNRPG